MNVVALVNRFLKSLKCWTPNICIHISEDPVIFVNKLNIPFTTAHSTINTHPIHICLPKIASNLFRTKTRLIHNGHLERLDDPKNLQCPYIRVTVTKVRIFWISCMVVHLISMNELYETSLSCDWDESKKPMRVKQCEFILLPLTPKCTNHIHWQWDYTEFMNRFWCPLVADWLERNNMDCFFRVWKNMKECVMVDVPTWPNEINYSANCQQWS